MKREKRITALSDEVRQKLAACKTAEEAKKILAEAGVEPLNDELLDRVSGGYYMGWVQETPPPETEEHEQGQEYYP